MISSVIIIVACLIVIVAGILNIRYSRIATVHWKATEWYSTHRLTDPKPAYVLKSEQLRAGKENGQ
jgi:hypothetical protein